MYGAAKKTGLKYWIKIVHKFSRRRLVILKYYIAQKESKIFNFRFCC